jgi:hypothetical protein
MYSKFNSIWGIPFCKLNAFSEFLKTHQITMDDSYHRWLKFLINAAKISGESIFASFHFMSRSSDRTALFEIYTQARNLPPQHTFEKFQRLSFDEIPQEYRAKAWKLLSKTLPFENRGDWADIQEQQRKEYYQLYNHFIRDPNPEESKILLSHSSYNKLSNISNKSNVATKDSDLSESQESQIGSDESMKSKDDRGRVNLKEMFVDLDILEQIERDLKRTFLDLAFFQKKTLTSNMTNGSTQQDIKAIHISQSDEVLKLKGIHQTKSDVAMKNITDNDKLPKIANSHNGSLFNWLKLVSSDEEDLCRKRYFDEKGNHEDTHWEAMERILYLFAKTHPQIEYVQGMNNIIAPIYYVLANDPMNKRNSEPDCFFIFQKIMSEIGDLFIRSLDDIIMTDDTDSIESLGLGVGSTMDRVMILLENVDPELHEDMVILFYFYVLIMNDLTV